MEKTSENKTNQGSGGITISPTEAEEFCRFKRQKRREEVEAALARSSFFAADYTLTPTELRRIAEGAKRIGGAAVKVHPVLVPSMRYALGGSKAAVDAIVGGTGESTVKVKAYEAKRAVREGAREITLVLCRSALKNGRTGDTRKEVKKVCRAAKKAIVKIAADAELGYEEFLRLARLASETGAKFLSVPYFAGVERLRRDMHDQCMLEVTGVENAADYKTLVAAGVERIGSSHAETIYKEWMAEAEKTAIAVAAPEPKPTLSTPSSATVKPKTVGAGTR